MLLYHFLGGGPKKFYEWTLEQPWQKCRNTEKHLSGNYKAKSGLDFSQFHSEIPRISTSKWNMIISSITISGWPGLIIKKNAGGNIFGWRSSFDGPKTQISGGLLKVSACPALLGCFMYARNCGPCFGGRLLLSPWCEELYKFAACTWVQLLYTACEVCFHSKFHTGKPFTNSQTWQRINLLRSDHST